MTGVERHTGVGEPLPPWWRPFALRRWYRGASLDARCLIHELAIHGSRWFVLPPPLVAGQRHRIICISATGLARGAMTATGIFPSGPSEYTFTGVGQSIDLVADARQRWSIMRVTRTGESP